MGINFRKLLRMPELIIQFRGYKLSWTQVILMVFSYFQTLELTETPWKCLKMLENACNSLQLPEMPKNAWKYLKLSETL